MIDMTDLRKTTQYLLPVEKKEAEGYDIYPVHDMGEGKIYCDYESLARRIAGSGKVVIDGYVGVRFDIFAEELNKAFASMGAYIKGHGRAKLLLSACLSSL